MILSSEEIKSRLEKLNDWALENSSLVKKYSAKDFIQIMGVVTRIALISEKIDHHPDLLIHGWNKLKITISTHSEGGVTIKDFELAQKIDELLNE